MTEPVPARRTTFRRWADRLLGGRSDAALVRENTELKAQVARDRAAVVDTLRELDSERRIGEVYRLMYEARKGLYDRQVVDLDVAIETLDDVNSVFATIEGRVQAALEVLACEGKPMPDTIADLTAIRDALAAHRVRLAKDREEP